MVLTLQEKIATSSRLAEQFVAEQSTSRRRDEILEAAHRLMVDGGVAALTLRGVARAVGMSPGNLNYHFPSYDGLLDALLQRVIAPYLQAFEFLRAEAGGDPITGLRAVMNYVLEDLATRDTTLFFPELWVLSDRDSNAARHMQELYDTYQSVLKELIASARPDLTESQVAELALFICATIEGQTVFIGHQRPYAHHREALRSIALDTMISTVEQFAGGSHPLTTQGN